MKKHGISKRILSLLLSVVMVVTMIPSNAFAEETKSDSTQTQESSLGENLANALGADSEKFYEVKFALPNGLTDEEAAEIKLPDTKMIAADTLIAALPAAEWAEHVFLGWCYDEELKKMADIYDAVERNMTLYPSFIMAHNYDDEFQINYISDQDVDPEYEIRLIAYGLSEEMIRELITVTDLSKVECKEDFVLELAAPELEKLISDERYRALVWEAVSEAQEGEPDGTLTDALTVLMLQQQEEEALAAEAAAREAAEKAAEEAVGNNESDGGEAAEAEKTKSEEEPDEEAEAEAKLDEAAIKQIVAYYAPEEIRQTTAMKAVDLLMRAKKAGLNTEEVKPSELLEIATEEELEQLGLILPEPEEEAESEIIKKAWEIARQESLDEPINLDETFEEDLATLPVMYYTLRAVGGWNRGDLHQVEILDTSYLRYYRDENATGQYVIYYNITVAQQNFNNMQLNSNLVFLPLSEVDGVELDGGLIRAETSTNGDMTVSENTDSGVLNYSGSEQINAGMTVAVYDGTLNEDGTVNGSIGYFNITESLGGGKYAYGSPDFTDVVFTPDIIPAKDDGSFDDGEILLTSDQLDFSGEVYKTMGLNENTVIEAGDFLAIYTGDLSDPDNMELIGYGCITAVEESEAGLVVRYDPVTEGYLQQSADMYMKVDNVPVPLTEEEIKEIEKELSREIENSEFMKESSEYVTNLIMNEDAEKPDSEYGRALQEVKFQREDGGEISLEEVRKLAGGGKVEVKWPPELSIMVGLSLQHFDGTGIRGEAAAQFEIIIHINDEADIKITVVAMLELEVALGLTCKVELEWRKAWIFPYIYDISGHVGVHAGIYIGLGVTVTVQTTGAEDEDTSVADLMPKDEKTAEGGNRGKAYLDMKKFATGLKSIADAAKKGEDGLHVSSIPGAIKGAKDKNGNNTKPDAEHDEMHNTVGGGFEEKYANFVQESDAEYVPLLNKEIVTFQLPSDPLHILAISLGINFVVKFKLNVMLGASLTYGNAKEVAANFTVFHPNSETTTADLETPNFQVDFFIFGMVGIRAGIMLDLRVGALSTKLASIGVTAEIGAYLEFYGYFYVSYKWEAGSGSSTEMFGSMLVQLGIYLDIKFKAQMGDGKLQKEVDLYDVRFPLLSLGDEFVATDFEIEDDDESLSIDITKGGSAQVPDELFDIQFLEIATGDIDSDNMDRDKAVNNGAPSFTAMGITYSQMDETYFHVTYTPKGEDFADATAADAAKGGFLYDPVNNTIYAKPNDCQGDELEMWGEFTFTWYQGGPAKTNSQLNYGAGFGLNTREISRTVQVHWKGVPCSATADVYLVKNRGYGLGDMFAGLLRGEGNSALEDINGVSFKNAKSYYTKTATIEFNGFDGVVYYMDLNDLQNRYPGYSISFAKESYDKDAIAEYAKRNRDSLDMLLNGVREAIYANENDFVGEQGWLYVDDSDTYAYFMMHLPITKVELYFDYCDIETDWHILDSGSNGDQTVASVTEVKVPNASKVMEVMPDQIKNKLQQNTDAYDYKLYMYSDKKLGRINYRYKGRVITQYRYTGSQWEEIWENGTKTQMPAFDEFIGDRTLWTEVTEDSIVSVNPTVIFAVRTPKIYTVTWKYDDGDQQSILRKNDYLRQPKTPERAGYQFTGYWLDEDGNRYFTESRPFPESIYEPTEQEWTDALEKAEMTYEYLQNEGALDWQEYETEKNLRRMEREMRARGEIESLDQLSPQEYWELLDQARQEATEAYREMMNKSRDQLISEEAAKYVQGELPYWEIIERLEEHENRLGHTLTWEERERWIEQTLEEERGRVRGDKEITYLDSISRMPTHDLTLYPEFEGLDYTVTWIFDGEIKTSQAKQGDSILAFCPFGQINGKTLHWYTNLNDPGTMVPVYYQMEAHDLTVYGKLPADSYTITWMDGADKLGESSYEEGTSVTLLKLEKLGYDGSWMLDGSVVADGFMMPSKNITLTVKWEEHDYLYKWVLYDTGNKQYTEQASVSAAAQEKNVADIIPASVRKLKNDTRYTYQLYRYDNTNLNTVKANSSKWVKVYDETAASYNDATYILQRAPIMVNVTWKYDDGDVVTNNWVGRKLTAPKEISRTGYDFAGWAGENGNTYSYPPYYDITLYPQFAEHEHTWDEGEITTAATCVDTGVKTYTCTDCGKTKTETIAVDPNNHIGETEIRNAREATCSEEGYTGDTYCKSCGAKISDGQLIEKKAHAWDGGEVTSRATCVDTGVMTYTCTNCGETKTETIDVDPDAHDWKQDNIGRSATIREMGDGVYGVLLEAGKEKRICQLCGTEETGDPLLLTPTIEGQEISVYDLFADERRTTVADCRIPLEFASVHVEDVNITTYGLDPDRTNDQWISATFEWAEDYSDLTLAEMEAAFADDVNATFTLKVIIHPYPQRFSWYHDDDPSWYGRNGRYDVEGFESDFTDGEGTIVITSHEHEWDYDNVTYAPHTDTEDGYYEYSCTVEGCTKKNREVIPAGHVWETTDTHSHAYAEPVAEGTPGAMQNLEDGNWYLLHCAVVNRHCTLCDVETQEETMTTLPFSVYTEDGSCELEVFAGDLISAGMTTIDTIRPAELGCAALVTLPIEDSDEYAVFKIGGAFVCKDLDDSTALEGIYDDNGSSWYCFYIFVPDEPDKYEPEYSEDAMITICIRNERSTEYHDALHGDEAMADFAEEAFFNGAYWIPAKTGKRCAICGIEKDVTVIKLMPKVYSDNMTEEEIPVFTTEGILEAAENNGANAATLKVRDLLYGYMTSLALYYSSSGYDADDCYLLKLGDGNVNPRVEDETQGNLLIGTLEEEIKVRWYFDSYNDTYESMFFYIWIRPVTAPDSAAEPDTEAVSEVQAEVAERLEIIVDPQEKDTENAETTEEVQADQTVETEAVPEVQAEVAEYPKPIEVPQVEEPESPEIMVILPTEETESAEDSKGYAE